MGRGGGGGWRGAGALKCHFLQYADELKCYGQCLWCAWFDDEGSENAGRLS